MKHKRFHFAALALALTGSLGLAASDAAKKLEPSRAAETAKLNETLTFITREYLKLQPDTATSLAVPIEEAGGKYADRLPDYSEAGSVRLKAAMKDWLARLDQVNAPELADTDRISLDVVRTALVNGLAPTAFLSIRPSFWPSTPYVINQLDCAFTYIPDFLDSQHPLKSAADAADYLKRLSAYGNLLDQETARLKSDAKRGLIPPDFALAGAIKQLEKFAALPPAETVLVSSMARRVKEVPAIDAKAAADLVAQAGKITRDEVLPAYRRQVAALEAVQPQAPKEPGIWRLQGGDKYYGACLKAATTSDLTPDQIHELGLKLVAKFTAEADPLLRKLGYEKGSVAERLQALSKDERQLYPNTDAGRTQLVTDLNRRMADITAKMPLSFGILAKARVEIKRVPTYIEAGAIGGYYTGPALDGSRPGAYYINLRDTAEVPRFTLPTLTYHEAVPGHHWQTSIAQESGSLPRIRSAILGFAGYSEGWALYAEQLADEMGAYQDDPAGRVGYLQSMLFRAARLVVDTGIHHLKWTREQAIDYMVSVTGDQRSTLTTEVERYAVWPGQACAYMVGREEINRLRDKARAALGPKFDLKSFHDVLLSNGAMPLTVMARVVEQWIAAQNKAAAQEGPEKSTTAHPPPYLGQPVPGMRAERFAPGLVCTPAVELNGVFSPDGREFYFTRLIDGIDTIHQIKFADGKWGAPRELLLFPDRVRAESADMFISTDNRELYFLAAFPRPAVGQKPNYDLWVSRRVNGEWAQAALVPPPISTKADELYPVLAPDGSLYFNSDRDGAERIYRASRRPDGGFDQPQKVELAITREDGAGDLCLAPDGSYLIMTPKLPGGRGRGDLHVSFRQPDGRWGELINLGDQVNTAAHEWCPMVTPDGKYLFFSRWFGTKWGDGGDGEVYWVDIRILDQFRPNGAGGGAK